MLETNLSNQQSLSLPITATMLSSAQQLAQQAIPNLGTRIVTNALSVAVVNTYMEMMAYASELSSSDSWNPLLNQFNDVADLHLPGIGRLECRCGDAESYRCSLPLDLPLDCVGLVALELDLKSNQATLLGFAPNVKPGDVITVEHLQPLETVFDHLEQLEPHPVNLGQWLQGEFNSTWQAIDALVGQPRWNLAHGLLNDEIVQPHLVGGAKVIDLGINLGEQSVVLLVAVVQVEDDNYELNVQLHPPAGIAYLLADVSLTLQSDTGDVVLSVLSRQIDNFIQLPRFQCHQGEQFSIEISYYETSIAETFVV